MLLYVCVCVFTLQFNFFLFFFFDFSPNLSESLYLVLDSDLFSLGLLKYKDFMSLVFVGKVSNDYFAQC